MGTARNAIKSARYLVSLIKPLTDLDEELEAVGSVEQMIAARQVELASFEGRIETAKMAAAEEMRKAQEAADVIAAEAARRAKEAEAMLADAQEEAAAAMAAAREAADKMLAEANAKVNAARNNREGIDSEIALLAGEKAALVKAVADTRGQLQDLTTELARMKAKFA